MLGAYGAWAREQEQKLRRATAAGESASPPERAAAGRRRLLSLMGLPFEYGRQLPADVHVAESLRFDGLSIEQITWQLPYGPATEAIFLKPADAAGPLPAVLALHDHSGFKFFGKEKVAQSTDDMHPKLLRHYDSYYGGVAWANRLARRGYAVLIHDVFTFGSRKILASDLPAAAVSSLMGTELATDAALRAVDTDPDRYELFAAAHESIIAKSLFCAGMTWPGLALYEDGAALSYLCGRSDVDEKRVGCCGLSGGGLRTNYLAAVDDRIACSVSVCFMSSWRDFLLNTSYMHTWMLYVPSLSRYMDYPEVVGLRAPKPAMVLATDEDPLFSLSEVKRAASTLEAIYENAGKSDRFCFSLHAGGHQFNRPMQDEAFQWIDRWLAPGSISTKQTA